MTPEQAARLERLAQRRTPTPSTGTDTRRTRRAHPAKGARVAALGMSLATTAGLAALFATTNRPASAESAAVVISGGARIAGTPSSTTTVRPTVEPTMEPTVVDGAVLRNKWGPVQVEATFAPDGSLAEVVALQTPDDRSTSRRINDHAVPQLTSEALTAQTASVHTISGATYTSDGYRKSLQSAIDAARAAGITALS